VRIEILDADDRSIGRLRIRMLDGKPRNRE
jgi:hypothetical protein